MSSKHNPKAAHPPTASNSSVSQQLAQQLEATPESEDEEIPTSASALSLGVRAQKKLLSKLSSKSVAKIFIDETSGRIMDNIHKLARAYANKKEADKLLKSIIKTIVKIGILHKNDLFTDHDLKLIDEFRNRFHSLAKAIVTLHEVNFRFDRSVLIRLCKECQDLTHKIISTHLTPKSHSRIDYVYNFVGDLSFLEYAFNPSSAANRAIIQEIVDDMNTLMDAGFL